MRVRSALGIMTALPFLAAWSFLDPFHENVQKGNRDAQAGRAEEAIRRYAEAARVNPGSPIPDFNRGIVLAREGRAEEARDSFAAAAAVEDPALAADALYNMGNVLLEAQQFEPAIESYLKSLDLDPEDADARRNLEIAMRRLQEQEEQEQQEQEEDGEGDPEEQRPESDPGEEDPEEDSREEPPQQEPGEEEEPEQQPTPQQRMSREDAERLLNAIQSDELQVLRQLQEGDEEEEGVAGDDW